MDKHFEELRKKALIDVKEKIKESVNKDLMIINAINNIEELEKSFNVIVGRLREWFLLKNPELEKKVEDNERIVEIILKQEYSKTEMGSDLEPRDEEAILSLALLAQAMTKTKEFLSDYLDETMNNHCKNILALAGATIGAKLLREAGSLKRLASLQSGTVQLLGAEKALFRHIKTGARPPKHGHIINHPIVNGAINQEKGKAARALADKITMCARLDYFKGEFTGHKYFEELKNKFNKN
jgi:nucleolar protein 56